MSEKQDWKLESVVLSQYHYRHEAEFAAGFLDDAGIPYRLQVDDAGLGMTISTPATLWVRGMDLKEASEVLDLPDRREGTEPIASPREGSGAPALARATSEDRAAEEVSLSRGAPGGPGRTPHRRLETPGRRDVTPAPPLSDATVHRLTGFERLLALVLLVGDVGVMTLTSGMENGAVWLGVLAAAGVPLATAALAGRTFPAVRRLLRGISGSAP